METLCRIHISWENFRKNLHLLLQISPNLIPVIKANAYGHGVCRAAAILEQEGVGWAAVGTLEEGAEIRSAGFTGCIVALLSHLKSSEDVDFCLKHRLLPLAHRWEDLLLADAVMCSKGDKLDIAFKVETGMNRLGFPLEDVAQAARFMKASGRICPKILISHLAVADDPEQDAFSNLQSEIFWKSAALLREFFPDMHCSLNNTAGLLRSKASHEELCRPGLALYGYNPLFGSAEEMCGQGLLPVMGVSAPLVSTHILRKGESLGYGRTYASDSDRLIGWAAIGYANGYRRDAAPGRCMCLRGVRVPVIGRIAMQMTCLDLSALPFTPDPGEDVYAMGGPGNAVTAQELAQWWGTIPYEVTCLLGTNPIAGMAMDLHDGSPATKSVVH